MLNGKRIGVVIPCYNERSQILSVLRTLPNFVDLAFVVDDASLDDTATLVSEYSRAVPAVRLIRQSSNSGVGSAIAAGYAGARAEAIDVTVVVAGDGQMDPADMRSLVEPVIADLVDYAKGNRFLYVGGLARIPGLRLFGNFVLSAMTKISTGYWHVSDSQCGYTALNDRGLDAICASGIYPSYGCPNDILTHLNIAGMRVGEVPVNPLYGVGEKSKMRIPRVILPITLLLARNFVTRIFRRFICQSGHPLVFAYLFSFIGFALTLVLGVYLTVMTSIYGAIPKAALTIGGVCLIMSCHFLLSAFEMDFNANQSLQIELPRPRARRSVTSTDVSDAVSAGKSA